MNTDIKTFTQEELHFILEELGEPKYRAKQLYEWLHTRNASSYEEMTNLPKSLREKLQKKYPLKKIKVFDKRISEDGTRKYIFKLDDDTLVETVGIITDRDSYRDSYDDCEDQTYSSNKRLTVCFSTQAGCRMGCVFCATGKEGFTRNLTATEMVDQITAVKDDFASSGDVIRVNNVVAMGQGEPFLNYEEVIQALYRINNDPVLEVGARRITVSTCGIIKGIERFTEEPEQYRLAISLHAADQKKRNMIMPALSNQPLHRLKDALLDYTLKKNRRITFEYLMIDGVNDNASDLTALVEFCSGLMCHINLIPLNSVEDNLFTSSTERHIKYWETELHNHGIPASIRFSKGADIAGACGQLKASYNSLQKDIEEV